MCGIVGLHRWPSGPGPLETSLKEMASAIVHRGPDDEGFHVEPDLGLGMRRLSIIDVEGGHQPMENEDGSVVVVFNGEIYNFQDLREELVRRGHMFRSRADTEVIVHAYEEYGPACVGRFNGIFAFAVWDARARRLVVARDRIGIKPLYYVRSGDGLAFASEVKALLRLRNVERVVDAEAAAEFFRLGFVTAPRTLFRGIRKLAPGSLLIAEGGRIRLEQYWDLEFQDVRERRSFGDYAEELRGLLDDVVADQMISDVPLGAFLSGGVDSSGVVACMRKAHRGSVLTFSIGFGEEHAYHNEAPYAEAVARELDTKHQTLIVRPNVVDLMPELIEKLDEPLTDTSFLVTYLVSTLAARDVKVALSGVGGDELFAGYRRYLAATLDHLVAPLPRRVREVAGRSLSRFARADRSSVIGNIGRYVKAVGRTLHMPLDQQYGDLVSVLSADHVAALVRGQAGAEDPATALARLFRHPRAGESLDRLLYVDMKTALPESLLLLTDKMGMAASLEVRVPFLDNRIVDFVRRVPPRYRMSGFALKRLLKAALRGAVPDFVLRRSKRGFGTPMSAWLRHDLRDMVHDVLARDRVARAGLLDADVVARILAAHDRRGEDVSEAVVALLTFELWRERFQMRAP